MASRAEFTIFDEPCAGLDAPARQLFYDHLLADHVEQPRTVLLSTHLIDEASEASRTRRCHRSGHESRSMPRSTTYGVALSRSRVQHVRLMLSPPDARPGIVAASGRWVSVTVAGPLDPADRAETQALELDVSPVPLQQLLVHSDSGTGSLSDRGNRLMKTLVYVARLPAARLAQHHRGAVGRPDPVVGDQPGDLRQHPHSKGWWTHRWAGDTVSCSC